MKTVAAESGLYYNQFRGCCEHVPVKPARQSEKKIPPGYKINAIKAMEFVMGYVFSLHDVKRYMDWLNKPQNSRFQEAETRLMEKMLNPSRRETFLDIGCGSGHRLLALLEKDLQVTGIDPSPQMLDLAAKTLGHRADLHRGTAEDLPFEDNAFTYAALVNTLEFVEDPKKALEEAFRVARERVFIGIVNRHSGRSLCLRTQRLFTKNLYSRARFFSIWEVKRMIRALMGNAPVFWQTVLLCPNPLGWLPGRSGRLNLFLKSPVGPFTGITVVLAPRFITRPLRLKCHTKPVAGTLTGLACRPMEERTP